MDFDYKLIKTKREEEHETGNVCIHDEGRRNRGY